MPFLSDTASAFKSRFGFHDHPASESIPAVRSTPDVRLKSVSRENHGQSSAAISRVRSMGDWDDDVVSNIGSAQQKRTQSFEFAEDPSFWKDHNVQVIIRIRPLSSSEISVQGHSKCVKQESYQAITWTGPPDSRFTFDLVADESISQEKMFKVAGLPMVENCVSGYNSCMFAYGQTGSGKTHTMLGDIEGGSKRHSVNCGMTPRVFDYMFSRIQKEKEARKDEKLRFTCKCSFLEIYNEQILDLLDPASNNLQIREDIKKGIHVENLKEVEVTSARDVIQQLIQGAANRKVAATNMNLASSRSHSVFTCIIESKWETQGVTHHRFARLNLVDLAGSERQKSSGAEGERLKEATNINKSLSTLGLVIMNLVNISNGKSQHVPYRDSKLTFLLQDSLGGNSKTTIIANISPSICSSLETLSTLKFAQRAKFIKNNAIINEDASGDVIAMRMQIQDLKKEISRLRSLVNGGENLENDTLEVSFPGSPGAFKWQQGDHGSASPLTFDKRASKRKDFEAALVGAFRREKEKESALQALAQENQAALQLAKQREDEIQGLKMRLRFREAGIKRLEAVAKGKISAETHLLEEREEYLKEIEVFRAQVGRNQEVTRFAMENLQLKEEIKRLKSFHEEGEREMVNEQIKVLQNKLLEALDWKLMHESDLSTPQKDKTNRESHFDGNLLTSSEELGSSWCISMNEENEFLRMQAIQNKSEMDTLRKTLSICLEQKEQLAKCANDLAKELEEEKSYKAAKEAQKQREHNSFSTDVSLINFDDQIELKTMVDAIATASQKEAEAHETSIKLSKENDELRMKLKVLIEDNNKLIELYEQAAAEINYRTTSITETPPENGINDHSSVSIREVAAEKEVENLENQLKELHEENEKLLSLYETAMQERDAFKRMSFSKNDSPPPVINTDDRISNGVGEPKEKVGENVENLENQLKELHEENDTLMGLYEKAMQERDEFKRMVSDDSRQDKAESQGEFDSTNESCHMNEEKENQFDLQEKNFEKNLTESILSDYLRMYIEESVLFHSTTEVGPTINPSEVIDTKVQEDIFSAKTKLERAEETLSESAKSINAFVALEKSFIEISKLSTEIETIEVSLKEKQQQFGSLKLISQETIEKKSLVYKKFSALKYTLASFDSSATYLEQREVRARGRVFESLVYVNHKKENLASLRSYKTDIKGNLQKTQQVECELRNNHMVLKSKLDEENRRQDNDKVMFSRDNIENKDGNVLLLSGKATDLLKAEEAKTKLQTELKTSREKLCATRMEYDDLNNKLPELNRQIRTVEAEIEKGLKRVEETELALQGIIKEEEILFEIKENSKTDVESLILEYQERVFEADLREAELVILGEELDELRDERAAVSEKATVLVKVSNNSSCLLSERMEMEMRNVLGSVVEAKKLLLA